MHLTNMQIYLLLSDACYIVLTILGQLPGLSQGGPRGGPWPQVDLQRCIVAATADQNLSDDRSAPAGAGLAANRGGRALYLVTKPFCPHSFGADRRCYSWYAIGQDQAARWLRVRGNDALAVGCDMEGLSDEVGRGRNQDPNGRFGT